MHFSCDYFLQLQHGKCLSMNQERQRLTIYLLFCSCLQKWKPAEMQTLALSPDQKNHCHVLSDWEETGKNIFLTLIYILLIYLNNKRNLVQSFCTQLSGFELDNTLRGQPFLIFDKHLLIYTTSCHTWIRFFFFFFLSLNHSHSGDQVLACVQVMLPHTRSPYQHPWWPAWWLFFAYWLLWCPTCCQPFGRIGLSISLHLNSIGLHNLLFLALFHKFFTVASSMWLV